MPLKLIRKTANGDLKLDGVPVHILGTIASKTDMPVSGIEVGAGYFVGNDLLGIWDGMQWVYLGIPSMSDMEAIASSAVNSAATNYATAAQGAKADTALQTETDPVYTADKPTLALKTELEAVAEIANGKLDATATAADSAMLGGLSPEEYVTIEGLEGLGTFLELMMISTLKMPRVYTQAQFSGLSQIGINLIPIDTLVAIIEG